MNSSEKKQFSSIAQNGKTFYQFESNASCLLTQLISRNEQNLFVNVIFVLYYYIQQNDLNFIHVERVENVCIVCLLSITPTRVMCTLHRGEVL
jgi:phage portal protein BeeE